MAVSIQGWPLNKGRPPGPKVRFFLMDAFLGGSRPQDRWGAAPSQTPRMWGGFGERQHPNPGGLGGGRGLGGGSPLAAAPQRV